MTSPTPALPVFSPNTMRAVTDAPGYSHLVSLPPAMGSAPRQPWPLVVFLHGAGERGSDPWNVTRHGLPRLLALGGELTDGERTLGQRLRDTAIVVAPQCPHYEVWNETRLLHLLDSIAGNYHLDGTRVYLTGLSMGGFGTWTLGLRHPDRFAAIVPICGGGRIADVLLASDHHGEALRSLGVWAFHGARDRVVPVEESERMIHALESARVRDARLTVYPEAEHDSWTVTYSNPEVYDWMFRHPKGKGQKG